VFQRIVLHTFQGYWRKVLIIPAPRGTG